MRRTPRIAAVAFAVLSVLAVIVVPLGPGIDQPGSEVVDHLTSYGGAVRLRALLAILALLAFVVVVGYARERLEGAAGHIFIVGAAVLVAQMIGQLTLTAGMALHASSLDAPTARLAADVAAMWGPMLTAAGLMLAGPVVWAVREGRFPRWLGVAAAVFAAEQVVGILTIIGPAGSFIAPAGPMTDILGGGVFLGFLCALGFATAGSPGALSRGGGVGTGAETVPKAELRPESSSVSVARPDITDAMPH